MELHRCKRMSYYRDDTANRAIAHVMRERKKEEWLREHPKQIREKIEYVPGPPVDVQKILRSKHKKVYVDKAWAFCYAMRKKIGESIGTDNG